MASYCEESEYKGYPTIKIFTGREYNGEKEYVSMGVKKAGAVCEQIDVIRRWLDKQDKVKKQPPDLTAGEFNRSE